MIYRIQFLKPFTGLYVGKYNSYYSPVYKFETELGDFAVYGVKALREAFENIEVGSTVHVAFHGSFTNDDGFNEFDISVDVIKNPYESLISSPIEVYAKRASNTDPKFSTTYLASEFPFEVVNGQSYKLVLDTSDEIIVKASRKGRTLYTGSMSNKPIAKLPSKTGQKVKHTILAVLPNG